MHEIVVAFVSRFMRQLAAATKNVDIGGGGSAEIESNIVSQLI